MDKLKRTAILLLCLYTAISAPQWVKAEIQNYISQLDLVDLRVDELSYIDWGCVDNNKIELYQIENEDNGYIEFTIQIIEDVEVSLVESELITSYYGFKLESGTFRLIVGGIIEDVALPPGITNNYIPSTIFKVEKCDNKINYFKDGNLVYAHCSTPENPIEGLFHRTEVIVSNGGEIDLVFESESVCSSNATGGPLYSSRSSETSLQKNGTAFKALDSKYEALSSFTITASNSRGKVQRQWRRRTNSLGILLGSEKIRKYVTENPNVSLTIKKVR